MQPLRNRYSYYCHDGYSDCRQGYLGYATEPLLLLVAAIAGLIAYRVGVTWDEMMDEICQKIAKGHAGNPDSDLRWCAGWYLDGFWYYPDDDLLWCTDCKPRPSCW